MAGQIAVRRGVQIPPEKAGQPGFADASGRREVGDGERAAVIRIDQAENFGERRRIEQLRRWRREILQDFKAQIGNAAAFLLIMGLGETLPHL